MTQRYFPQYGYGTPPLRQIRTVGKTGKTDWLGSASNKPGSEGNNAFVRVGTSELESVHGHGLISYPYVRMQSIAHENRGVGMYLIGDEHPVDGWYSQFQIAGGSQQQSNDYRGSIYMLEYDANPTRPGYSWAGVGIWDWTDPAGNAPEATSYWSKDDNGPGYIQHMGLNHYFYDNPQHGGTSDTMVTMFGPPHRIVQIGTVAQNYNLNVLGVLTKSSGSFDIEHPTVQGKRLRHSFIEGPQADLIYRGTAKLGAAPMVIDMDTEFDMTPGTWEALNCTPWSMVSASGKIVEWEFAGSTLTITGDEGTNCMWMVIGERHDPHMKGPDCSMADGHGHLIVEYDEPEPLPTHEPEDATPHQS